MQEKTPPIQVTYYLDILSRRRWFVIIPFCLVMIIGIAVAIKLPKLYSATTMILIQPQTVPSDYVRPLTTTGIESRIASISQEIKSRSNLENIINNFNLFTGPENANIYMEDKISKLRDKITVEVFSDRRSSAFAQAFSISFKGENPEDVKNITNYIAESFINENMRMREQESLGTSGFIEGQLDSVRLELETLEQELKIFRENNMGGLPEQLDTNLRILDRLQMQYNQKQESLREIKKRLVLLDDQIIETENFQHIPAYQTDSGVSENDPYVRLQNMKQELENLQSRYTEVHPEVVKLKIMINNLETQIKKGVPRSSQGKEGINLFVAERLNTLKQQKIETIFEMDKLENDIQDLSAQTKYYQQLVDETPQKEQELITLNRDYQNMRDNYNSLLEKKMQANLAVNLEINKKGEQFRVLDRAKLPNRPSDPDMNKLFLVTFFAAMGLGGCLVLIFEYLDSCVKNVNDLESELGLPVLTSIPKIYTMKDRIYHRLNLAATTLSIMVAMVLCASFGLMALGSVEPGIVIDLLKILTG